MKAKRWKSCTKKPLLAVDCFLKNIFQTVKIFLKLKKTLLSGKDVMHLGNFLACYNEFCKKKTALLPGDQQDKIIRRG